MAEDVAAIRAVVHGRVQGVGFREFVVDQARRLHLVGRVRNLGDGRSVEVVAEGPRDSVEEFVLLLQQGPRSSHVDRVDLDRNTPRGEYQDFRTAY